MILALFRDSKKKKKKERKNQLFLAHWYNIRCTNIFWWNKWIANSKRGKKNLESVAIALGHVTPQTIDSFSFSFLIKKIKKKKKSMWMH